MAGKKITTCAAVAVKELTIYFFSLGHEVMIFDYSYVSIHQLVVMVSFSMAPCDYGSEEPPPYPANQTRDGNWVPRVQLCNQVHESFIHGRE